MTFMVSVHKLASGFPVSDFEVLEIKDVGELAPIITGHVWSQIIWAAGARSEDNFTCTNLCAFDFDEGPTLESIRKELAAKQLSHIIGTTKSHGLAKGAKPACDRFRVVVPFNDTIWDLDTYRYNVKKFSTAWGSDLTYDGARIWQTCKLIDQIQVDGECLRVDFDVPEEETTAHRKDKAEKWAAWRREHKVLPPATMQFLKGHVESGNRNRAFYFAAVSLLEYGHSCKKVRDLCLRVPGMRNHDGFESTLKSACRRAGEEYE